MWTMGHPAFSLLGVGGYCDFDMHFMCTAQRHVALPGIRQGGKKVQGEVVVLPPKKLLHTTHTRARFAGRQHLRTPLPHDLTYWRGHSQG